jgi:EmrB/QacA subfamily drug resistance transporter
MTDAPPVSSRYKWTALSNTTLGAFMATLDASIVIISLPAIFRGIHLNPLEPSNISYLLWMLMGYLVCTAVLVVTFGRLGDIYGRVRMYNAGFAVFTAASIALSLTPGHGSSAAIYLIVMRVVQGVGGSMLLANATAILTDAFPVRERGRAMGINSIAAIAGSFVGLVLGGILADWNWRLVFWVNVPFGIFGTIWAYRKLVELGTRKAARIDWLGNITFAVGLVALLTGITYGIQPYGGHTMGWTRPFVLTCLIGGIGLLIAFCYVELRVKDPMFNLHLFRIRAFTAGNAAGLFAAVGRGGLQFMLIIWLQGIWLPLHGYRFESTPLWAGIFMIPLTVGLLVSAPIAGQLSDQYGARGFATGGMLLSAVTFLLLMLLPADFNYATFALLIFLSGVGMGVFVPPNTTAIMNSVPNDERGQASGMRATFQNSGTVLSIGIFFSLMIVGLAASLPATMSQRLTALGVRPDVATQVAKAPPVGSLFAAFLGYNPMQTLLGPHGLDGVSASNAATITGKRFFPELISTPFIDGLRIAFTFSLLLFLLAAWASWKRGAMPRPEEEPAAREMWEEAALT